MKGVSSPPNVHKMEKEKEKDKEKEKLSTFGRQRSLSRLSRALVAPKKRLSASTFEVDVRNQDQKKQLMSLFEHCFVFLVGFFGQERSLVGSADESSCDTGLQLFCCLHCLLFVVCCRGLLLLLLFLFFFVFFCFFVDLFLLLSFFLFFFFLKGNCVRVDRVVGRAFSRRHQVSM